MSSTKYLTRIAVTGANGSIARAVINALLQASGNSPKSKNEIRVLLPPVSFPIYNKEGVEKAEVDYDSVPSIAAALAGVEFLIITLPSGFPLEPTHSNIVRGALQARVPFIVLHAYEYDIFNPNLVAESEEAARALRWCREVKSLSVQVQGEEHNSVYVALICGFLLQDELALGEDYLGIDTRNKRAVLFDDGLTRVSMSTVGLLAQAVVGLLRFPEAKIRQYWGNKAVYVASFTVSQRQILDAAHRVMGTKDEDWVIRYQDAGERYNEGLQDLQEDRASGAGKTRVTPVFFKGAGGDFESLRGVSNSGVGIVWRDKLDDAVLAAHEQREQLFTPIFGEWLD
ncbi:Pinoresinol reductase 2 [Cladorrhinum sp. PSN332]|nr:Pinoresinol reductase 2 [Cladorrhinum sp. PSN332]